jgi:hypothetical protein
MLITISNVLVISDVLVTISDVLDTISNMLVTISNVVLQMVKNRQRYKKLRFSLSVGGGGCFFVRQSVTRLPSGIVISILLRHYL